MTVVCVMCGELITLRPDSEAARDSAADPRQQLRRHLNDTHNLTQIAALSCAAAWLLDLLAFRCPMDQTRWRELQITTLDWTVGEIAERFAGAATLAEKQGLKPC